MNGNWVMSRSLVPENVLFIVKLHTYHLLVFANTNYEDFTTKLHWLNMQKKLWGQVSLEGIRDNMPTWIAMWTLLSTPVHSRVTVKGVPAASLILVACSLGVLFREMRTVRTPGTNFFAKSSRFWKRSVITIGSAPAALAERSDMRPIGPAPLFKYI